MKAWASRGSGIRGESSPRDKFALEAHLVEIHAEARDMQGSNSVNPCLRWRPGSMLPGEG